ncbi:hypothetical protein [Amycolatopsis sp. CA-128772]|uniref:hypothetical protein n=1 Tax=Amycolatopsis sp. CA-128772 TaxID=2073159 RepID=UPI0011B0AC6D|nr:hypothetical protein [Amycolatopsis sp. CA-128772]
MRKPWRSRRPRTARTSPPGSSGRSGSAPHWSTGTADDEGDDPPDELDIRWMVAENRYTELRRHEALAEVGAIRALEALALPERYYGT